MLLRVCSRPRLAATGLTVARRSLASAAARPSSSSSSSASASSAAAPRFSNQSALLAAAGLATAGVAGWGLNEWRQNSALVMAAPKAPATPPTPPAPTKLPRETAVITKAPAVPPPIQRKHPVHLVVELDTTVDMVPIDRTNKYEAWTFNGTVPGPFIRARVGDVLEVRYTNRDENGLGHNIDFHCVSGPGGGAPALYAEEHQTRVGVFKLLHPGLYVYHCAAEPVPSHIANGMYGLILVEPEQGLPAVDREFYVMQSEYYTEPAVGGERDRLEYSYASGLKEDPSHVVFNGRAGSLTENPLRANQEERVRIYFGNAGPNLVSSFHVIGTIFDKVYREGDLISPPARSLQTTIVPAGGAVVVELEANVPGNYTLVDHSIFRIEKGCVGFLKISGPKPYTDVYSSSEPLINCPGCKLHN